MALEFGALQAFRQRALPLQWFERHCCKSFIAAFEQILLSPD
jgi:hypothetical protein